MIRRLAIALGLSALAACGTHTSMPGQERGDAPAEFTSTRSTHLNPSLQGAPPPPPRRLRPGVIINGRPAPHQFEDELLVIEGRPASAVGRPRGPEMWTKLPQRIVPLPLKHTDVKAQLSLYVGSVTVTQQYHNPYDTKIEAVYFSEHQTNYCPEEQTDGRVLKDRRLSRLLK